MRFKNIIFIFLGLFCCFIIACNSSKKITKNTPPVPVKPKEIAPPVNKKLQLGDDAFYFYEIAKGFPATFQKAIELAKQDSFQILYTEILRDNEQHPVFIQHEMFPKRQTKIQAGALLRLPLAFLAYQKMNSLKTNGIDEQTTMITEPAGPNMPGAFNDPTSQNGKPSFAAFMKAMLMQNDLNAYNRLFEFSDRDYLNDQLRKNGFSSTKLITRRGQLFTVGENRTMNEVKFLTPDNDLLFTLNKKTVNALIGSEEAAGNTTSLAEMEIFFQQLIFPAEMATPNNWQVNPDQIVSILRALEKQVSQSTAYANEYGSNHSIIFPQGNRTGLYKDLHSISISSEEGNRLAEIAYVFDPVKKHEFLISVYTINRLAKTTAEQEEIIKTNRMLFEDIGKALYQHNTAQKHTNKPVFEN